MSESKQKTDSQILKSTFADLNDTEKERFNELNIAKINEKYAPLIPKNSRTHTLVLENGMGCVVHHPKPSVLSKVMGALAPTADKDMDLYKAGCAILTNCWIAGDKQLEIDSDERFAIAVQAVSIVQVMEGFVKKN